MPNNLKQVRPETLYLLSGRQLRRLELRIEELEARPKNFQSAESNTERSNTTVQVQNTSGSNWNIGHLVGVGDHIADPAPGNLVQESHYQSQDVFKWEATDSSTKKFGILRGSTPDTILGNVTIAGVATARVNVLDPAHDYAKPSAIDGELESSDSGPVIILNIPDNTNTAVSVRECKVLLGIGGIGGSDDSGTYRTAWAYCIREEGIPPASSTDFVILESRDGSNQPGDVVRVTSDFTETQFETGSRRGTIDSFDGVQWWIVNEDRICPDPSGCPVFTLFGWGLLGNGDTVSHSPTPTGGGPFTLTGVIPPGLTFDEATGIFDGTLTGQVGDSGVMTISSDGGACVSTVPWEFSPRPCPSYTFGWDSLAMAQFVNVPPGQGDGPFIVSGNLPPGLVINEITGVISGFISQPPSTDGVGFSNSFTVTSADTCVITIPWAIDTPCPEYTGDLEDTLNMRVGDVIDTIPNPLQQGPYTRLSGSTLPDGVAFEADTGRVSGTIIAGGPSDGTHEVSPTNRPECVIQLPWSINRITTTWFIRDPGTVTNTSGGDPVGGTWVEQPDNANQFALSGSTGTNIPNGTAITGFDGELNTPLPSDGNPIPTISFTGTVTPDGSFTGNANPELLFPFHSAFIQFATTTNREFGVQVTHATTSTDEYPSGIAEFWITYRVNNLLFNGPLVRVEWEYGA